MKITVKQTGNGWEWRVETEDNMSSGSGYESRTHAREDALICAAQMEQAAKELYPVEPRRMRCS